MQPRFASTLLAALLLPVLTLLAAPQADARTPGERPWLSLGVATLFPASPYRGIDIPEPTTLPFVNWEGERFHLRGIQAGYRLNASRRFPLSIYLRPRLQGYTSDDSDALAGMDTRHNSVDGGLQFTANLTRRWYINARAAMDVLGVHRGHVSELTLNHRWPVSERLMLSPGIGAEWQSRQLVDYYYGVEQDEVDDPERPAYDGDAVRNTQASLGVSYRLTRGLSLFGQARLSRLDAPIRDSPLVDREHELSGLLALIISFY